ncbi:methylated-DNA--protein-cysteine S-methyltransferase [gut metagenome]|uniref:methylated-DNA--[protein]-cysteine S-methyltransferase n=1 Tax=gut metagenome TaxID=749906 RepID=J9G897_9ZZZZ
MIEWAQVQLSDYFSGKRKSFELPLYLSGTDFQLSVWNELIQIPYGNTISYAELARRIGRPTAIRAVANANNANPLSVFIPCHRVIGSNCELVGYGGGLAIKEQLLRLETGMKSLWSE